MYLLISLTGTCLGYIFAIITIHFVTVLVFIFQYKRLRDVKLSQSLENQACSSLSSSFSGFSWRRANKSVAISLCLIGKNYPLASNPKSIIALIFASHKHITIINANSHILKVFSRILDIIPMLFSDYTLLILCLTCCKTYFSDCHAKYKLQQTIYFYSSVSFTEIIVFSS